MAIQLQRLMILFSRIGYSITDIISNRIADAGKKWAK
jgi:hypothetical protein